MKKALAVIVAMFAALSVGAIIGYKVSQKESEEIIDNIFKKRVEK